VRRVALLAGVAAALVCAGLARADADPASDTLYTRPLFLPYKATVSPAVEAKLLGAIEGAKNAGKEIRVALIADPGDLGGVPQIFSKGPTYYARFLDAELQFVYTGRVLVVMPSGAALADHGRLVADKNVLAAGKPGAAGDALAQTATKLVLAISGATPVKVSTSAVSTVTDAIITGPTGQTSSSSAGTPVGLLVGIVIGVIALLLVGAAIILARRRPPVEE
jgi:hypothetical protein